MMVDNSKIKQAARLLQKGELVAFPTETVYGLGGNALSDSAVAKIYNAKGRPSFNPLIVHVDSVQTAEIYVDFSEQTKELASRFWPGPLTLVLPRHKNSALSLLLSAGLDTVAIRVPAHPVAQMLLQQAHIPIAAPSANRSGHVSPTLAEHVRDELGDRVSMILDGGACPVGIESTVVDMTGRLPCILRPGAVTQKQLEAILGKVENVSHPSVIKSPGMLGSHYAPQKPLRLNVTEVSKDEALLAFGPHHFSSIVIVENLSRQANLQEAAANLFRMLRLLDASNASAIAVMPIPEKGLGIAINDRLKRAASPRT